MKLDWAPVHSGGLSGVNKGVSELINEGVSELINKGISGRGTIPDATEDATDATEDATDAIGKATADRGGSTTAGGLAGNMGDVWVPTAAIIADPGRLRSFLIRARIQEKNVLSLAASNLSFSFKSRS